jgi:hypothetical protein
MGESQETEQPPPIRAEGVRGAARVSACGRDPAKPVSDPYARSFPFLGRRRGDLLERWQGVKASIDMPWLKHRHAAHLDSKNNASARRPRPRGQTECDSMAM